MSKFETLVDVFSNSIKTYPDNDLFGTKKDGAWSWITYLEFGKQVNQLRAGLAGLGIRRGDRVALIANNRVEWAVTAYACFGLGAALVPMYEAQHAKEWQFIAKDCGAKAIVVATDAIREKVEAFLGDVPSVEVVISLDPRSTSSEAGAAGKTKKYADLLIAPNVPFSKVGPQDVACFIYTSGTTGNPKGVILTHQNLASNVAAVMDIFPMTASDRSLSFLPWAHAFGQTCELHVLISRGASMAICESVDKIIDNLAETKPSLLFSVPRIFNKIYAGVQKQISQKPGVVQSMVKSAMATRRKQRLGEEVGLSEALALAVTDKVVFGKVRQRFGGNLRYAFSGGAAISTEVAEFIDGLGITVYEGYGLTETSPIATANWPGSRKIGSVGRAIPDVRIDIAEDGEIVIHGPNVMFGYHNRPEENDAVFTKDRGFRTGDMGRLDKDGFLFITGRIKEQYKLENGKYVVPTPLEEALKLSPYIANAMVFGDNRPFNVALVCANVDALTSWAKDNGVEGTPSKILESAKAKELFKKELESFGAKFKGFEGVKDFALIAEDFTTDNGMLTPSLKLKRRVVIEKYLPLLDALYSKKEKRSEASASA